MNSTRIPIEVLDVLKVAACEGHELRLTGQLDRALYVSTNKVLEALGGKWNRKMQAHVFEEETAPLIGDVVTAGTYVDAKKVYQFFETPAELAVFIAGLACPIPGLRVLEPSAGKGRLAVACAERGAIVECVEIQSELSIILSPRWLTTNGDFLHLDTEGVYDAVVMNPPFTRGQDMAHVRHAFDFLRPGGALVAIMSPGFTFRQDRAAVEFRGWLDSIGGTWKPLPEGTFRESGTDVRTVLVTAGVLA